MKGYFLILQSIPYTLLALRIPKKILLAIFATAASATRRGVAVN